MLKKKISVYHNRLSVLCLHKKLFNLLNFYAFYRDQLEELKRSRKKKPQKKGEKLDNKKFVLWISLRSSSHLDDLLLWVLLFLSLSHDGIFHGWFFFSLFLENTNLKFLFTQVPDMSALWQPRRVPWKIRKKLSLWWRIARQFVAPAIGVTSPTEINVTSWNLRLSKWKSKIFWSKFKENRTKMRKMQQHNSCYLHGNELRSFRRSSVGIKKSMIHKILLSSPPPQ